MRTVHQIIVAAAMLLALPMQASALPVDLSTFMADQSVIVDTSAGTVDFSEDPDFVSVFFFNDSFDVPLDAQSLTFLWELDVPGANDDALTVVIDFFDLVFEETMTGSGTGSVDLLPFRGQTISLEFGLQSNDDFFDSTAQLSNLQVNPIPEPATLGYFLLSGLLYPFIRKRRKA